MSANQEDADPMRLLDDWSQLVATLSGMRQQLLDSGWDKGVAETIIVNAFIKSCREG